MKITHRKDVMYVVKPEGVNVAYYLFPEYEVHVDEQLPHTTQTWHHHEKICETLYIVEGELTAQWKENGELKKEKLQTGDLIESEHTPHAYSNDSDKKVKYIVIKQVLTNEDKSQLLKTDKVIDQ
jgi:quercetin dioxygenase-like cupin family protein